MDKNNDIQLNNITLSIFPDFPDDIISNENHTHSYFDKYENRNTSEEINGEIDDDDFDNDNDNQIETIRNQQNEYTTPEIEACVLTCVLHEHAYLEHFIYYYQLLGFKHVYILKDRDQDEIRIQKNKFQIKITILPLQFPSHITNFSYIQYWNSTFMIKNIIKEDWILLCDIDEYLYLHGKNIHEYLDNIPNLDEIGQIQFPWMIVEHYGQPTRDLFQLLRNHNWFVNDEVKAIVRRDVFVKAVDNHHNIILPHKITNGIQKNIYTLHHQILTKNPKKRYPNCKKQEYYRDHGFMIHFHTRGLNNILLKILTYKYPDKAGLMERNKLVIALQTENFGYLKNNEKFKLIHFHKSYPKINKFPIIYPNIIPSFYIQYEIEQNLLWRLFENYHIPPIKYLKLLENPELIYR